MFKFIQRGLMFGLGTLTVTRKLTAKFVDMLLEEYQVKLDEGPNLVNHLVTQGTEERKMLHRLVRWKLENTRARLLPVTRRKFAELEWKVDELTNKLEILQVEYSPSGNENLVESSTDCRNVIILSPSSSDCIIYKFVGFIIQNAGPVGLTQHIYILSSICSRNMSMY